MTTGPALAIRSGPRVASGMRTLAPCCVPMASRTSGRHQMPSSMSRRRVARTLWSKGLLDEMRRRAQGPVLDAATVVFTRFEGLEASGSAVLRAVTHSGCVISAADAWWADVARGILGVGGDVVAVDRGVVAWCPEVPCGRVPLPMVTMANATSAPSSANGATSTPI